MASISIEKNGRRTIQFVGGDRKRRSIRLGKISAKLANEIKIRVEALNAASLTGHPIDGDTARWVSKIDSAFAEKLSAAGLISERAANTATLGSWLDSYISSRTDVKPRTIINLEQVRRHLLEFFGANRLLRDITPGDGDDFRRWMLERLGDNTVRRHCGRAKQFFRAAVRKRIITENPFADMAGCTVRANQSRQYFLSREDAAKVLAACPDTEWQVVFSLARFGGLRCPSEILELQWSDVDFANERLRIPSPKTERFEGRDSRTIPLFAELREPLEALWELAEPGTVFVINRYRSTNANLRTQLKRIIKRAGLKAWPKLFQNLRATRETELAENLPIHVVCSWLGNTALVAAKHYLQVTDEHFAQAITATSALQNPVQHTAVWSGIDSQTQVSISVTVNENGTVRDGAVLEVPRRGLEPP